MKSIIKLLFLIIFGACSSSQISRTPTLPGSIGLIQNCWETKLISCIEDKFGKANQITNEKLIYLNDTGNEVLTVYKDDDSTKIFSIRYWLFSYPQIDSEVIRKQIPSDDWQQIPLPERVAHVADLALANHSEKRGAHFLTYKLDKKQEVRVLYWGGDYKNISI